MDEDEKNDQSFSYYTDFQITSVWLLYVARFLLKNGHFKMQPRLSNPNIISESTDVTRVISGTWYLYNSVLA